MAQAACPPIAPGYLILSDVDGLRHAVRLSAIQMLSDGDPCRDTTIAVIAGRSLVIPMALDELLLEVERYQRQPHSRR